MAVERHQIYKCEVCGNIIEVLHGGAPALVCCNQPMKLYAENTTDAAQEKHVPVVETSGNMLKVKVGSTLHPMEDKHYIEWVEVIHGSRSYTHFFAPGDSPEAEFPVSGGNVTVRAYCNLHGLWKA